MQSYWLHSWANAFPSNCHFVSKMICKRYVWDEGFHFYFYFTCEQRKRSTEGSDEEKETPGKHEKKKSKKDKKKSKEKDSTDDVSKHCIGHLQDFFYRNGFINGFIKTGSDLPADCAQTPLGLMYIYLLQEKKEKKKKKKKKKEKEKEKARESDSGSSD